MSASSNVKDPSVLAPDRRSLVRQTPGIWLSASKITDHVKCPRYAYYQIVEGRKRAQDPGAAAGQHGHEQLEARMAGLPHEVPPHVDGALQFMPAPFGHVKVPANAPPATGMMPAGYRSETKIELVDFFGKGVHLAGKIDISNTSPYYVDSAMQLRESKGVPEILDYKFGKAPYWLTGSQLAEDIQLNLYALAAPLAVPDFPDAPTIRVSHVCAERPPAEGPPPGWVGRREKNTILRSKDQLLTFKERVIDPEVRRMVETLQCEDVSQTKVKAPSACEAYRKKGQQWGCAFAEFCTKRMSDEEIHFDLLASIQQRKARATTATVVADPTVDTTTAAPSGGEEHPVPAKDLFAQIKMRGQAVPAVATDATSATPAVPTTAPQTVTNGGAPVQAVATNAPATASAPAAVPATVAPRRLSALFGGGSAAKATPTPQPATTPSTPPSTPPASVPDPVAVDPTVPVTERTDAEGNVIETPATVEMRRRMAEAVKEAEAEDLGGGDVPTAANGTSNVAAPETTAPETPAAIAATAAATSPPSTDAAQPEAKRGRGRPRKEATVAVDASVTTGAQPPAATPGVTVSGTPAVAVVVEAARSPAATATAVGLRLFVDCYPSFPARDLEAYLNAICDKIAAEYGAPDIRCGSESGPLGYKKWTGVLAARIKASPPEDGDWFLLDVRGDDRKTVLASTLAGIAEYVVRGR